MYRGAFFAAARAAALVAVLGSPAVASGTYKHWDGSWAYAFGCGAVATSTFGQVITIPANKHFLNKLVFSWGNENTGSMVVRGEVYAWDGQKATGNALWEGVPRTITYGDGVPHRIHFNTGVLAVTPGQQYVIFASIDKDYEQCNGPGGVGYLLAWEFVDSGDFYPGGSWVFQNNAGNENNWTTVPWTNLDDGKDLVFRAELTL